MRRIVVMVSMAVVMAAIFAPQVGVAGPVLADIVDGVVRTPAMAVEQAMLAARPVVNAQQDLSIHDLFGIYADTAGGDAYGEYAAGKVLRRAEMKAFLRLQSRRAKDPADRAAAEKVLANPELFEAVCEGLHEQHASEAAGPVQDFLQWLLANQDSVFTFIKNLISIISHNDAVVGEYLLAMLDGRLEVPAIQSSAELLVMHHPLHGLRARAAGWDFPLLHVAGRVFKAGAHAVTSRGRGCGC